jgi:hypothetical protein
MKSTILGLVTIGLLFGTMTASAVAIQSSTVSVITFRDCVDGPIGPCEEISDTLHSEYVGLPGSLSSTATVSLDSYGMGGASTSLSGVLDAPILSAFATSLEGGRIGTNSVALQRYTYTGSDATTRTFGGTLDYAQSIADPNNALYDPAVQSGVSALIWSITSPIEFVEVGDTALSNYFGILAFAADDTAPGYVRLGEDIFKDPNDALNGSATLGVTVNLNPGDSVWVFALFQTPAGNGSIVDSMNTFVTGWDDITDLVPASDLVPVSEPGTLAVFSLALASIGLMRRRKAGLEEARCHESDFRAQTIA